MVTILLHPYGLRLRCGEVRPEYPQHREDIASFFGPLELLPPGIVSGRHWCEGWKLKGPPRSEDNVLAGVARKP